MSLPTIPLLPPFCLVLCSLTPPYACYSFFPFFYLTPSTLLLPLYPSLPHHYSGQPGTERTGTGDMQQLTIHPIPTTTSPLCAFQHFPYQPATTAPSYHLPCSFFPPLPFLPSPPFPKPPPTLPSLPSPSPSFSACGTWFVVACSVRRCLPVWPSV